jgi:hypothetical protein
MRRSISTSRKLQTAFLLTFLSFNLITGGVSLAAVEVAPFDDMDTLISESDLIVRAHVTQRWQNLRQTDIKLIVDEVFLGSVNEEAILVRSYSGKHVVRPEEPDFASYDKTLLYLKRAGDHYQCVQGAQGKKTIRNENIYLDPTNSFAVMHTKKYVKELKSRLKNHQ